MIITIETILHKDQRYPTVGDWQWIGPDGNDLTIKVSNMNNRLYEFLVAIHEMIEAQLCKQHGVSEQEVDLFDMEYEALRKEGDESEPGEDPMCPCHQEHMFAEAIERILANEMGIEWKKYSDAVNKLD